MSDFITTSNHQAFSGSACLRPHYLSVAFGDSDDALLLHGGVLGFVVSPWAMWRVFGFCGSRVVSHALQLNSRSWMIREDGRL